MKGISRSNHLIKWVVRMNYLHEMIVNNLYEPMVINFHKMIVYYFLQNDRKLTNV